MEKYAQIAVEAVHDALVALDVNFCVLEANESFCRLTDISRPQAEGRCFFDIGSRTWDVPKLRKLLGETLPKEKAVDDFLLEHELENLGRRVLLLNARIIEHDDLIVLAIEDVTALVDTGSKLREQEQRFRRLVEASAEILWTTDAAGLVVENSPSWRAFTGQSADEWMGEGWIDAVHPDDREETLGSWHRHVESAAPIDSEYRLWHEPSGTWRWINVRAVPLCSDDGTVRGWIGMNFDIDDRKRAEHRLRKMASLLTLAEHRERRLVSRILYEEVQQQLSAIAMKLQVARMDVHARRDEGALQHLAEVAEWLRGCHTMVHNLAVDMSPPILKHEGLAEAVAWLTSRMKKLYGLDVELHGDEAFPRFEEDLRVLLYRGVHELLSNVALHAGIDRATVELLTTDNHAEVVVSDEGAGFDPEPRIMERYREGGFGLFVLRERLELFGSTLEIDSSPGKGTRATIRLPVSLGTASVPIVL